MAARARLDRERVGRERDGRQALGRQRAGRTQAVAAALGVASLLSACAVGPDFKPAEAPAEAGYTPAPLPAKTDAAPVHGGAAQTFALGRDIQFDWWTLFKSPGLDALIAQAFKNNPTIDSAVAALKQAQESVYAQQGYFYPNLQANYSMQRISLSGNTAGSGEPGLQGNSRLISQGTDAQGNTNKAKPVTYTFHTFGLTVGYVPDVFGLNMRTVESLRAQQETQELALEATYITLASNVVAAALQEASTRAQIEATREIIRINEKSLEILQHQFKYGYAMGIDVAAQEAALAAARALLPPLEKQFEQNRDLLRALVGNLPNQDVAQTFTIEGITLPEELPVSLPSNLIQQRPDVRQAEAALHYASAQVGVAIANRLPQFDITAGLLGNATYIDQIFGPGGFGWNAALGITQPLFDGFTLLHRERGARQALVQAAAQYRGTVIQAYQNVADTLHAVVSDATALKTAVEAEKAAKVTLDLTEKQQQVGYVNYLTLLAAQQAYQTAITTRVQAQATRFGDAAALYQALGGGWWHREETATPNHT